MPAENPLHLTLNIPETNKPRVIIVGGGFGGLNLVKSLGAEQFQIVLFDKHNYNTFSPLLYQVATAGLQPDSIVGPLRSLFSRSRKKYTDFHFRMLKVMAVDNDNNTITTTASTLHYDTW